MTQLVSEWESFVFPTRTFIKEIAYWASLFVASVVFMYNILDTTSIQCLDNTCFTQDIVRNKEYGIAAAAFLIKHIVYTIDTVILYRRKVGQALDFITNVNHLIFWIVMVLFAIMFSSYDCVPATNIFKCTYVLRGQNNMSSVVTRDSRWPMIWVSPLIKLIVDICLLIYFHFVQKRRLSVSHGQALSVIALDVQFLLSCLHFNNNWAKIEVKNLEYYDAKIMFLMIFVIGFIGLGLAVFCVVLGLNEWKGTNSSGIKSSKKAFLLWGMALFWVLCFIFIFVFDGTAGNFYTTYKMLSFILVLLLTIIGLVYGIFNIIAKKNLEFTGYDVNTSVSRSQMG